MSEPSRDDKLDTEVLWMKDNMGAPTIKVVRYETYEALETRLRDQEGDMRRLRMELTPAKVREIAASVVDRHGQNLLAAISEWASFSKGEFNPAHIVALMELFYDELRTGTHSAGVSIRHPNAEQAAMLANEIERSEICKGLVYEDRGLVVEALRALAAVAHSAREAWTLVHRDDKEYSRAWEFASIHDHTEKVVYVTRGNDLFKLQLPPLPKDASPDSRVPQK